MLKQRWREIHREAEEGWQEFPEKGGVAEADECVRHATEKKIKRRHDRG